VKQTSMHIDSFVSLGTGQCGLVMSSS